MKPTYMFSKKQWTVWLNYGCLMRGCVNYGWLLYSIILLKDVRSICILWLLHTFSLSKERKILVFALVELSQSRKRYMVTFAIHMSRAIHTVIHKQSLVIDWNRSKRKWKTIVVVRKEHTCHWSHWTFIYFCPDSLFPTLSQKSYYDILPVESEKNCT